VSDSIPSFRGDSPLLAKRQESPCEIDTAHIQRAIDEIGIKKEHQISLSIILSLGLQKAPAHS